MGNNQISTRIKNKRDTDENFSSGNPVLLNGGMIIVDDNTSGLKLKFGDGVSTYSQLPFFLVLYTLISHFIHIQKYLD